MATRAVRREIQRGTDFALRVVLPYDITGYAFAGGIRSKDATVAIGSFVATVDVPTRTVVFSMDRAATAALDLGEFPGWIEETSNANSRRELVKLRISIVEKGA